MFRSVVIGAGLCLSAGFIGGASAADLPMGRWTKALIPTAPVYDWSGFYAGVNGGGASSRECMTITSPAVSSEGCHNATGAVAGGQVGYRWQVSAWVFGFEAMADWANLRGSSANLNAATPYLNQIKVDGLALFTGQAGYGWKNALLYVKGGAAATSTSYNSSYLVANGLAAGVPFNFSRNAPWGGTAGIGVEYSFARNWSVGVEYDHLFMGRKAVTFAPTVSAAGRTDMIGQDVDMGLVRVNYRFDGPIWQGG